MKHDDEGITTHHRANTVGATPQTDQTHLTSAPDDAQPSPVPASDRFPDIPCVNWRERGTVTYKDQSYTINGRALALVLWIACNLDRVNESRAQSGQIIATWKGGNFVTILGYVKVRF